MLTSINGPLSPPGEGEGTDSAALDAYSKTMIAVAERVGLTVMHLEVAHPDF
jgi:hypothetical protein